MNREASERQNRLFVPQEDNSYSGKNYAQIQDREIGFQTSGSVYKFYLKATDDPQATATSNKADVRLPLVMMSVPEMPQNTTFFIQSFGMRGTPPGIGNVFYDVRSNLMNDGKFADAQRKSNIWDRMPASVLSASGDLHRNDAASTRNCIGREMGAGQIMNGKMLDIQITNQDGALVDLTGATDEFWIEIVAIAPTPNKQTPNLSGLTTY